MQYNVYIVRDGDWKTVKQVGNNVSERMKERIVNGAMINLNHNEYSVVDVEVGSKRDLQFQNDLSSNQNTNDNLG